MKVPKFPSIQALGPLVLAALAIPAFSRENSPSLTPEWGGGFIAGYSLGQNGQPWPDPWREPLANYNRGGFYLSMARIHATLPFDSTFYAVAVGNLIFMDPQEAYLVKSWGSWRLKGGKLRGAGLMSGTGMDEFEFTTAMRPRYARAWNAHKRLHNFRDFGVQGEKDFLEGRVRNRLFFHNANGENVINDEPSFTSGKVTQALGLDYALDVKVSEYSTVGGHLGALADRQYDEFLGGTHEGWEVTYWLKTNAVVDASFYHRMDFPRLHVFSEAMVLSNRTVLHPDDSPWITWGASTLARFDAWSRWSPFLGYEFFDNSDGLFADDGQHVVRLGTHFRPAPAAYKDLRLTLQFTRGLEEGGRNLVGNDIFYAQLQSVF